MNHINIEGKPLLVLPALIDPHVHFRTPGLEHKEDWKTAAKAAVSSGVTTVCDMPNTLPACVTQHALEEKKKIIDSQLQECGIPLRYGLYFGADSNHLEQIKGAKGKAIALKIFMGCSTGGLVIDSDSALDEAFRLAAEANMLVAVHAEDESILKEAKKRFVEPKNPALHSQLRPKEAAIRATAKALALCDKYKSPLYILHMSTKEELELIRQAKKSGIPVYAEAVTHHLFLTENDYARWGTLVQMNPPLRTSQDQEALWEAINDGTIDTIATDHAPHTLEEKGQPFGKAPSGIPGVETLLPLLLDAHNRGMISLKKLIELTRTNAQKILNLAPNDDIVLVDLSLEKRVESRELFSKCGWSPYHGRELVGWPLYTVIKGQIFCSNQATEEGRQQLQDYLCENQGVFQQVCAAVC